MPSERTGSPVDFPAAVLRLLLVAGCVAAGGQLAGCRGSPPPAAGAVLVSCEPGGVAAAVGLQPDDVVTAWRRGDAGGTIESPLQLAVVEQQQAVHGAVALTVHRSTEALRIVVPHGGWLVAARPVLPAAELARYRAATATAESGDPGDVLVLAAESAAAAEQRGGHLTAAWWHLVRAVGESRRERDDEARRELEAGAALVADDALRAVFWEQAGEAFGKANRLSLAVEALQRSSELHAAIASDTPALAFTLVQLGLTDMRSFKDEIRRAVGIYRGLGGERIETAWALNLLAGNAVLNSDLDVAEAGYSEAYEIVQHIDPRCPLAAQISSNLGLVALKREDYSVARSWLRSALDIDARIAPGSLNYGFCANYLGLLAKRTGRNDEARAWFERALGVFRERRPGGAEEAGALTNLGNVAMAQDDGRAARRYHQQALQLREQLRPDGADVAASHHNLGAVARSLGDLAAARDHLEQALAIKQRLAPGTLWTATTLTELGELARAERRFEDARRLDQQALGIRRRVLPTGLEVAESLACLGLVAYDDGDLGVAEHLIRQAVDLIERHTGAEWLSAKGRSRFGGRFVDVYRVLALVLVEEGCAADGFELLDRARARELRAVVTRRLEPPAGVPRELWLAAASTDQEIERLHRRLAGIDPVADSAAVGVARARLDDLEARRDRLREDIAVLAPGLPAAGVPAPGLAETRAALDPGTLLLSYLVGDDRLVVFAVGSAEDDGPPVTAVTVSVTRDELERRIAVLRALIDRGRSVAMPEPALVAQAQRLHELLIEPVRAQVDAAERLLIVADGPLLDLPFAFLTPAGDDALPLGRSKALCFDPSAGVFVELRRGRRRGGPGSGDIVAVGGARYPAANSMVAALGLGPLAGSRREVESIGRLYGDRASVLVGDDASEYRLKRMTADARVLHLATHAVLDAELPLESALLFSRPGLADEGGEDGVLRAWEVIDQLHLVADVVVLSACTSAAGPAVDGEGRVGIARAFQLAGARSVLVSQWEVGDEATADLMTAFHRHLAAGRSTAEALRLAEDEIARGRLAHPFAWAAFQLNGDWW